MIREVSTALPDAVGVQLFDAVVLGGTLGIFLATALQLRGRKVAVIERNQLVGRDQEWNISRSDMQVRLCPTSAIFEFFGISFDTLVTTTAGAWTKMNFAELNCSLKLGLFVQPFVSEGILTEAEVEDVIVSEFNPVRVAFENISEITTTNILNCGVSPRCMIELLKQRFLRAGG